MATQDPYALSDEDRLPWLEPVDAEDEPERGGGVRWLGPLAALLLLVGLAAAGVWWWQNRAVEPSGTGELIAAPEGPYKVKAPDEGGMTIEGQGQVAFETSEGGQVKGALDLDAVPEAPVGRAAPPAAAPAPKSSSSAVILENKGGTLVARAVPAEVTPEGAPGATIQLGAFPTNESARKTWDQMSKRFAYLGERTPAFIKADVNGRTFHRLRMSASSAAEAKDICARLRVAGENCLVVN